MHWRSKWQPTPVFSPGESQGQARHAHMLSEPQVRCNLHGQGYFTTVGAAWWLSRQPSFSGFRGTKLQGQPEVKCALKEKGSANPPRTRSPGILITGVLEQKVVSITVWVGFGE